MVSKRLKVCVPYFHIHQKIQRSVYIIVPKGTLHFKYVSKEFDKDKRGKMG